MNNEVIKKEIDHQVKLLTYRLAVYTDLKRKLDSGKYKFECAKSYNGYHEWRSTKAQEKGYLEKCLPYCYFCAEIDETNTKKDTPIPGDRNWRDRKMKLIKI